MKVRCAIYLAFLVASLVAVAAIHAYWPGLRFDYSPLNYVTFAAVHLSVPLWLFLVAGAQVGRKRHVFVLAAAALAALPTGLLSFGALQGAIATLRAGVDPSLQLVSELPQGGATVRLYRTNANPLKAYGLVLRSERPVVSGLKYVTEIKGFYESTNGTVARLPSGHIQVRAEPYNSAFKPQVFEFAP